MFDAMEAIFAANKVKRELVESGAVGHAEPDTVVTYDGNKEGKEIIVFDEELVRISSTVYDFNNLEKLITNGQESTSEIWTVIEEAGAQFLVPQGYEVALFLSASAETLANFGVEGSGGVYINNAFSGFLLALYFHGTIHPIDPKYLPEMTPSKPVITFEDYGIKDIVRLVSTGGGTVTYSDVGTFWEDVNKYGGINAVYRVPILSQSYADLIPTTTQVVDQIVGGIFFRLLMPGGGGSPIDAAILVYNDGENGTVLEVLSA